MITAGLAAASKSDTVRMQFPSGKIYEFSHDWTEEEVNQTLEYDKQFVKEKPKAAQVGAAVGAGAASIRPKPQVDLARTVLGGKPQTSKPKKEVKPVGTVSDVVKQGDANRRYREDQKLRESAARASQQPPPGRATGEEGVPLGPTGVFDARRKIDERMGDPLSNVAKAIGAPIIGAMEAVRGGSPIADTPQGRLKARQVAGTALPLAAAGTATAGALTLGGVALESAVSVALGFTPADVVGNVAGPAVLRVAGALGRWLKKGVDPAEAVARVTDEFKLHPEQSQRLLDEFNPRELEGYDPGKTPNIKSGVPAMVPTPSGVSQKAKREVKPVVKPVEEANWTVKYDKGTPVGATKGGVTIERVKLPSNKSSRGIEQGGVWYEATIDGETFKSRKLESVQKWADERATPPTPPKATPESSKGAKEAITVFHGSPTGGWVDFDDAMKGSRMGKDSQDVAYHFSDSFDTAKQYSQTPGASRTGMRNPNEGVLQTQITLTNPKVVDKFWVPDADDIATAKSAGHDGFIIKDPNTGRTEYVVFDKNQIGADRKWMRPDGSDFKEPWQQRFDNPEGFNKPFPHPDTQEMIVTSKASPDVAIPVKPWQVTKAEYEAFNNRIKPRDIRSRQLRIEGSEAFERYRNAVLNEHRGSIESALKEGKPVPAEVLADYPDLAAKYGGKSSEIPKGSAPKPLESIGGPPREIPLSKPTGEIPKVAKPGEVPEPSGISRAAQLAESKEHGTKAPVTIRGDDHETLLKKGQSKLDDPDNPFDAERTASDLAQAGRPATDEEYGAFAAFKKRLESELKRAKKALDEGGGDHSAKLEEYDRIKQRIDDYNGNINEVRSASGRSLSAIRVGATVDWSDVGEVLAEARRYKGTDLTPGQEKRFTAMVNQAKKSEGRIAELETELAKLKAEGPVNPKAGSRGRATQERAARNIEAIKKEIDDIFKDVAAAPNIGHVAYDALKFGYAGGRLAKEYLRMGVGTLDEAITKAIADLAERGINVDRQRIIDDIDEMPSTRTRSDLQKQIAKATAEAKRLSTRARDEAAKKVELKASERAARDAAMKQLKAAKAQERAARIAQEKAERAFEAAETVAQKEAARSAKAAADANQKAAWAAFKEKERIAAKEFGEQWKYQDDVFQAEEKIADLKQQLNEGRFRVPTKRENRLTAEREALRTEAARLQNEIRQAVREAEMTTAQKVAREIGALPRALQATADASAVLRQGLLLGAGNPGHAAVAFGRAAKAAFSPKYAAKLDKEIAESEMQSVWRRAKLYIAPSETRAGPKEEQFFSNFVDKIPIVGILTKAAARHYTTYLNQLRTNSFNAIYHSVPNMTDKEAEALASLVNIGSGRGDLGKFNQAADGLASAFFSPRLLAARIQAPLDALGLTKRGKEIYKSRGARRQQIQSWATLLGSGMIALELAKANGAEVSTDPDDPDFGKIKSGDTSFDIWGGFQQPVRLFARTVKLAKARAEDKDTKGRDILTDVTRFLRYKASPGVNLASMVLGGKDAVGQDVTPKDALLKSIAPLYLQELSEALKDSNVPNERKAAIAALGFFGVGTSTYERKK